MNATAILMAAYVAFVGIGDYDWIIRILGPVVIGFFAQAVLLIGVLIADQLSGARGAIWDTDFAKLRAGALLAAALLVSLHYSQRRREQAFVDCMIKKAMEVDFAGRSVPSLVTGCRPRHSGYVRPQD